MRRTITTFLIVASSPFSYASDRVYPDPITYEWTVEQTRRVIPKVDFTDTTIRQVIFFLGNSMDSPIRLEHNLSADVLDKKIAWQLKDVSWIQLVAKIADIADAEIRIGKQVVTLHHREEDKNEQNKAEMATPRKPSD